MCSRLAIVIAALVASCVFALGNATAEKIHIEAVDNGSGWWCWSYLGVDRCAREIGDCQASIHEVFTSVTTSQIECSFQPKAAVFTAYNILKEEWWRWIFPIFTSCREVRKTVATEDAADYRSISDCESVGKVESALYRAVRIQKAKDAAQLRNQERREAREQAQQERREAREQAQQERREAQRARQDAKEKARQEREAETARKANLQRTTEVASAIVCVFDNETPVVSVVALMQVQEKYTKDGTFLSCDDKQVGRATNCLRQSLEAGAYVHACWAPWNEVAIAPGSILAKIFGRLQARGTALTDIAEGWVKAAQQRSALEIYSDICIIEALSSEVEKFRKFDKLETQGQCKSSLVEKRMAEKWKCVSKGECGPGDTWWSDIAITLWPAR